MYGIIIKKSMPVLIPFPTVKSSFVLFIIWALHVEQPCVQKEILIESKKTKLAILNNLLMYNMAESLHKQQHL